MPKRIPDFIGVGVARCATSWTFRQLLQHPQIGGAGKELNLFSEFTAKRWDDYRAEFARYAEARVGEWSPRYFTSQRSLGRIAELCPAAVILVNVRNPVDRVFSWYDHRRRNGLRGDFWHYFRREDSYGVWKSPGFYYRHLRRWSEAFGDRLRVGVYDDLVTDPQGFLAGLYGFLGVDATFRNDLGPERAPRGRPDGYDEVLEYYRPSIGRLEEFLGRDLSAWY